MAGKRNKKARAVRHPYGAVLLLLLLLCGIWLWWDNHRFVVEETTIAAADLPEEFDGLRIVQLSDNHGMEFGENNEKLLTAVAEAAPDLIFITGDLIDQYEQYATVPPLASGLVEIAPTYYVTGNHEWAVRHVKELKELLKDSGVRVLTNDFELWTRGGATLAVAGVDDPNGPADQKTPEEVYEEIDADFTLLLSHRDTVETYGEWDYDVVFCGHGHGGLIRIPFLDRGLVGHGHRLLPEYSGGLYELGNGNFCYVSRGIGNNTVPFPTVRVFNPPTMDVVTLRSAPN